MRDKRLTIFAVIAVCIGLMMYLFVYSVPVDKVAAHYRFGEVIRIIRPTVTPDEDVADRIRQAYGEDVKIVQDAGWFWKLPWPFDEVREQDQRIRHLDGPLAQIQLPDGNQVVPRVYATWRVVDPVAFQRSLSGDKETAALRLRNIIGNYTASVFGEYELDDLVNAREDRLQFDSVETGILNGVQQELAAMRDPYGVDLCSLGITWIALPEDTTQAVFERMRNERQSVAERLVAEGEKLKRTKIAEAQTERDRIIAEAMAEAKDVRAQAEAEAAAYYETFAKDQQLAIFLRQLEALRRIAAAANETGQPLTLLLGTDTPPFKLLEQGPDQAKMQIVSPPLRSDGAGVSVSEGE